MAIKFSQFNLRTDHTEGMYLVGYDGNQNIHITVDNLFDDFINGTENTIAMFGTGGTELADSMLSQNANATLLTVAGQLNVDSAATFDTSITVSHDSTLNGNVILGNASTDLITQNGTLYLNGPVKDTTDTLGAVDQVLLSDATGELTFTDLADLHVGGAEVVEVPVKNVQGSALVKGDPVYISGSVGASGRLEVQLADASNALKMPAVGLLKQNLANNAEGFAVVTGKLRNLITDPIDGVNPTENDVIYVKPSGSSGAALTTTKPVYGNFIQNIGKVGRVSTAADGNLVVSSILRTNDIPNLTPGRLWIGSTGNTIESQTLFVDEANTEVGIGTATPQGAKLHVVRSANTTAVNLSDTDTRASLKLKSSSSSDSQITFSQGTGATQIIQASNEVADTARNINLNPFGGRIGIGTVSPSTKLHVVTTGSVDIAKFETTGNVGLLIERTASTQPGASKLTVANNGQLSIASDNLIKFLTSGHSGGTERMRISNDGNVGIGTTSPDKKLHISATNAAITNPLSVGNSLRFTDDDPTQNNGQITGTIEWETRDSDSAGIQSYITTVSTNTGLGNLAFGTGAGGSASEKMRLKSDGQLQINTYGSGTFTGTATKNLAVDSSGNVIETDGSIIDGSGTANYVSKWSDPNTLTDSVIYDDGTDVGIGTATPGYPLDVQTSGSGDVVSIEASGTAGIRIVNSNAPFATRITSLSAQTNFKSDGSIEFYTDGAASGSGTARMIIENSSGDVGIGTSNPSNRLHVLDDATQVASFKSTDTEKAQINVQNSAAANKNAYLGISTPTSSGLGRVYLGPSNNPNSRDTLKLQKHTTLTYPDTHMNLGGTSVGDGSKVSFNSRWNTADDANFNTLLLSATLDGTDALTGDRQVTGLNVDIDSTATGGNTLQELTIKGINIDVNNKTDGDANHLYGVFSYARNTRTGAGDNMTSITGGYFQAYSSAQSGQVSNMYGVEAITYIEDATHTVNNAYAVYGRTTIDNSFDDTISSRAVGGYFVSQVESGNDSQVPQSIAVYAENEVASNIDTIKGVEIIADINGGTTTDSYLIRGSTQIDGGAAITNNWGLYLYNIDKNYLEGTLRLPAYGQGNVTGTAAKNLAVDSNGNVIETDGGVVDGSGTANYVSKWSDSNTLTDSIVYDDGTNVGIGTTSPSNGKLQIDSTGNQISIETGTPGDGRLHIGHFSNGTFIGTYGDDGGAADLIRFGTHSGDERMRITSDGRVGIGTTVPDIGTNLHVLTGTGSGQIKLSSQANTQFQFHGDGNQDINYGRPANFPDPGGDAIGQIRYGHGSNYMAFKTNNAERMRINSSGNVGIGTTSPSYKIHAVGSGNVASFGDGTRAFKVFTDSDEVSLLADGNVDMKFYTSAAERMRIDSSGNVGIGTTTPVNKLDVAGDIGIDESIIHNGDTDTKIGFVANDNFAITTAGVERVRVTSGGSVGIATNNPGAKLDVEGNAVIGAAGNIVNGDFAVAINKNTVVTSEDGFAQGENTIATGRQAAAFGFNTYANGPASIAGGSLSETNAQRSIAVGATAITNAEDSAAFNTGTRANGLFSFAIGQGCFATNNAAFASGSNTQSTGLYSFSGGVNSIASGNGAVALGGGAQCSGEFSFAAGNINVASGLNTTALGFDNDAIGNHSAVIGHLNTTSASGVYGVAINFQNTVSGQAAFAFNQGNTVSGLNAAAGGVSNTVDAEGSFAYGFSNDTSGSGSTPPQQILLGRFLKPPRDAAGNAGEAQVIVGRHNKHANQPATAFAVGTGTATSATANSFTVQYDGNVLMEQVVSKNYTSDSAAAAAGVPIGGIYHNSGDLKIRLT